MTLEQSLELREIIVEQESRFEKLLENKNLEINQLKAIIEDYKKKANEEVRIENQISSQNTGDSTELIELFEKVKNNPKYLGEYEKLLSFIQGGWDLTGDVSSNFIALMESNDIIENKAKGIYKLTPIGRKFVKLMTK